MWSGSLDGQCAWTRDSAFFLVIVGRRISPSASLFGSTNRTEPSAGGVHLVQLAVADLEVMLAILQPGEPRDRGAAEVNLVLRPVHRFEGNGLVGLTLLRQRSDRPVRYGHVGVQLDDGVSLPGRSGGSSLRRRGPLTDAGSSSLTILRPGLAWSSREWCRRQNAGSPSVATGVPPLAPATRPLDGPPPQARCLPATRRLARPSVAGAR